MSIIRKWIVNWWREGSQPLRIAELEAEVERLRADSRRYYLVDGSSLLLDDPSEVVRRRVRAANEHHRLRDALVDLHGRLRRIWAATIPRGPIAGEEITLSRDDLIRQLAAVRKQAMDAMDVCRAAGLDAAAPRAGAGGGKTS